MDRDSVRPINHPPSHRSALRRAPPAVKRALPARTFGENILRDRLMAARQGLGIIFFGVLFFVYAANFVSVAAKDRNVFGPRKSYETVEGAGLAAAPVHTVAENEATTKVAIHAQLPGAVSSTSTSFDSAPRGEEPVGRVDMNVLPGAIGLGGPFDNNNVAGGAAPSSSATSSTNASVSVASAAPTQSSQSVTTLASTTVPASSSISEAVTEDSSVKKAAEDDANVIRDGLGHIIPQKPKKKKKKKKRARKSSKSRVGSSEEVEKENRSAKEGSEGSEKGDGAKDEKKEGDKSSKSRSDDLSEGEAKRIKSEGADVSKGKAKKAKSEDDEVSEASADSPAESASKGEIESTSTSASPPGNDLSSISMPPVDVGEHPMSRTMTELQVEGGEGILKPAAVKKAYKKLVNAYLKPFKNGIKRRAFFDILRRKNYSLAPPESNKGIQTILIQIISKKIYIMDPYEVAKNSKAFYRTRIKEMIWLLAKVAKERETPDTEFLVAIHDCVQTVSKKHAYRGAHYMESSPTFTIVACNFSDNIPFPMWEGDEQRGGGLRGWDLKMKEYGSGASGSWEDKKSQAVFRGGYRASMYFEKKKEASKHCDEVGRSRLAFLAEQKPELFDVSIGGKCGKKTHVMSRLSERDHHSYKYILYAEGNCFWADRINKQVFGPSAIIKQETPCGQFFEPLLRPMTHYIPTDFFFSDAPERIEWANEHSKEAEAIVKNANEFAGNFLTLSGIETYVEVLLEEYTQLLEVKTIEVEKGAADVTDGNLGDETKLV